MCICKQEHAFKYLTRRAMLSQLIKDSEGCTGWGQVFYCCTDLPLILEGLTDDTDYFCNLLKSSLVENLSFHIHILKYYINILLDLSQRADHLAKAISVFCSSRYSVKSSEGKELSKVYLLWQAGTHHGKQTHQQTKRCCFTLPLAAGFRQEAKGQQEMDKALPFNPWMRRPSSKQVTVAVTLSLSWTSPAPSFSRTYCSSGTNQTYSKAISIFSFRTGGRELSFCDNSQIFLLQKISLCSSGEFTAGGSPKGPEHQVTQHSAAQHRD